MCSLKSPRLRGFTDIIEVYRRADGGYRDPAAENFVLRVECPSCAKWASGSSRRQGFANEADP